jgi:hypothetical protein
VQQPDHPEFVKALQKLIKKFADEFNGRTAELRERAQLPSTATRLTNTSKHRRSTKGHNAIGKPCAEGGRVINADGEFHHPQPVEKPTLIEPVPRACHEGGAFQKKAP